MVMDVGWIGNSLTDKGLKWDLSWMAQCGGHKTSVQHGTESPVPADLPDSETKATTCLHGRDAL